MAANFRVISTQPWIYQDETNRVVNGFRVFVVLTEFNETHEIPVPSLDPATVKAKVEALLKQRKDLSTL